MSSEMLLAAVKAGPDAIEKLQAMEKDTTPGFGGAKK